MKKTARAPVLKTAFTVAVLTGLKPPAEGRLYVYDTKTPALALCITSTGTKTFYLYRKVHGKPQRVRLGKFPPLTIEQARDLATRTHAEISYGANPNAEKRAARQEMTLGQAFDHYRDNWLAVRGAASTLQSDDSRFDTCFGPWRGRKLSSITRADVSALHAAWGLKGRKTTANRAVQLLRRLFNHTSKALGIDLPNPAQNVDLFREEARERILAADELPRFFAAVEAEVDETFRDFFLLAIWTGARRGNVLRMQWDHINLDAQTWTIPAEEFKTRRPMTVALSPEALAILRRREPNRINAFVFPGRGKTGHLVEPKTAWERIRLRTGLLDLRMHDLRRTLGSWQAALGTSLHIIGKSLGHARQETTAIYARLNLDPVRASVNAATAAIVAAGQKKEGSTNGQA